ncbi:hypothetical protein [Ferrimonas senticii]|uniref:hypothetical protein n=1 Tax=Ferrimonas senticii TaxID=394566 RepID=UPI0004292900|nr:hypothetical protein [Ferrimonas senticii]
MEMIHYSQEGSRLTLRGGLESEACEEIKKGTYRVLHLKTGSWPDLSVLRGLSLEGLIISSDDIDWDSLYQLKGLKRLELRVPFKHAVDFYKFPQLEFVKLIWSKCYNEGSFYLEHLEVLIIEGHKGADISEFPCLNNLKYVEFIRCAFNSMDGIDRFANLKGIYLYSLPKLLDISAFTRLHQLKSLEIDCCKRIGNFEAIGAITHLSYLMLTGGGVISSLDFIKKLKQLAYLAFGNGTKVETNDLTPLYKVKSLKRCRFHNSRGYNLKQKDVEMELIKRHGKLYEPEELMWDQPRMRC